MELRGRWLANEEFSLLQAAYVMMEGLKKKGLLPLAKELVEERENSVEVKENA